MVGQIRPGWARSGALPRRDERMPEAPIRRLVDLGEGFPAGRILNVIGEAAFLDLRKGKTCALRPWTHYFP